MMRRAPYWITTRTPNTSHTVLLRCGPATCLRFGHYDLALKTWCSSLTADPLRKVSGWMEIHDARRILDGK